MITEWEQLSKQTQRDVELVASYAAALLESGVVPEAERVIRSTLKREWSDRLVRLRPSGAHTMVLALLGSDENSSIGNARPKSPRL